MPTFSISGFKIEDKNGNGVQDAGEDGIQGWKVILKNTSTGVEIASTTTSADGYYKFPNLTNDRYNVTEENKENFSATNATFRIVTIEGNAVTNIDFTNKKLSAINMTSAMVLIAMAFFVIKRRKNEKI